VTTYERPVLDVPDFDRRCRFHDRPFVSITRGSRRVALFCAECDRIDAERITRQAGQSWDYGR